MAHWAGLSHALAAIVVLLIAPVINRFVELLITLRDLERVFGSIGTVIASHPLVPLQTGLTTTVLYLATIGLLAFVWGYAYHVRRHYHTKD